MPEEKPVQFPVMQITPTPQGVLIRIAYSPFNYQDTIIPPENADAMAVQWLATRPPNVLKEINQAIRVSKQQQEDMSRAVANPKILPLRTGLAG